MYKKVIYLLVVLLAAAGSISAQGDVKKNMNPVTPRWFVSGGVNGSAALNGSAVNELNAKIAGGLWFNKIIGARVTVNAGNSWLKGGYNAFTMGAGVDLLANLMKHYADEDSRFRLSGVVGIHFGYYSFPDDFPNQKHVGTVAGNFGLQAAWKLTEKLEFYVEPGVKLMPKYWETDGEDDPFTAGTLTLGVTYNF